MTWETVEAVLKAGTPKALAYDGCHKIYVAMDDNQVRLFQSYGYTAEGSVMVDFTDVESAMTDLHRWYDDSCALRFISAVKTVSGDPWKGFVSLIEQGEDA